MYELLDISDNGVLSLVETDLVKNNIRVPKEDLERMVEKDVHVRLLTSIGEEAAIDVLRAGD